VGVQSARTAQAGSGILVDYSEAGTPIGLEITAPGAVTAREINAVLEGLGQPPINPEELAPLRAA
jgi:uncharacterized protein YuzE